MTHHQSVDPLRFDLSRRSLLGAASVAGAATGLGAFGLDAAAAGQSAGLQGRLPRQVDVVVVGAGIAGLVALITSGALAPDDRLPPVRQLANDLGLAAGTVARAYRELEQDGWVHTKRGGGTRVDQSPPSAKVRTAALGDLTAEFVQRARFLGADDATITAYLDKSLSRDGHH